MPQNVVTQIDSLVQEHGRLQGMDVSGWTTRVSRFSCMVSDIPNMDQARALSDFLRARGMMAEIVPPSPVVTDWGVVAVSI